MSGKNVTPIRKDAGTPESDNPLITDNAGDTIEYVRCAVKFLSRVELPESPSDQIVLGRKLLFDCCDAALVSLQEEP